MDNQNDCYTILGVPRDASSADIRRAYRALAKALHPDSIAAGSHAPPEFDFRTVTEAYEILKDHARRAAYDADLNRTRQVASAGQRQKGRGRAFAAGLMIGILFAVGAIGAKIYADRTAGGQGLAKSQDSLRVRLTSETASAKAALGISAKSKAPDEQKGVDERPPDPPLVRGGSEEPRVASLKSLPEAAVNMRRAASLAYPSGAGSDEPARPSDELAAAPMQSPGRPALEPLVKPVALADPVPRATESSVSRAPDAKSSDEVETSQKNEAASVHRPKAVNAIQISAHAPNAPMSALAESVLSLEGKIDGGLDGVAAYRLVSVISSATNIEDLAQAGGVANKPETRELINGRIAALKLSQSPVASPGAQVEGFPYGLSRPVMLDDGGSGVHRADGGFIEVSAGMKSKETLLKLIPGNGLAESFADCANCPEMVVIPSGQAIMGSRPEHESYRAGEAPAHRISIRRPLAISKYGVSLGNWRACVEAGACRPTLPSLFLAGPDIPATRVSWFDAKAYTEWLSQATGRRYRLLSEAEWEYAARAGAAQASLDGDTRSNRAVTESAENMEFLPFRTRLRRPAAATRNPWGLYALREGALEWIEDCWHANYDHAPADGSPWLSAASGDCAYRVVRGGFGPREEFGARRAALRAREYAEARSPNIGFRVVREIQSPTKTALDGVKAQSQSAGK